MSTPAQILANRRNSRFSTGPVTPQGLAASSRNATSHGLSSSNFAFLPHEDRAEFDRLIRTYRAKFQPLNSHEVFLVESMVHSRWKLDRIRRMESALVRMMCKEDTEHHGPDAVIAAAMLTGKADAYSKLQRYAAAAERSYYKALRELEKRPEPVEQPQNVAVRNEPDPPTQALPIDVEPPSWADSDNGRRENHPVHPQQPGSVRGLERASQ